MISLEICQRAVSVPNADRVVSPDNLLEVEAWVIGVCLKLLVCVIGFLLNCQWQPLKELSKGR